MDTGLIVTLTGIVGVIVAILALLQQTRDTHLSLGVQILRDLEQEFNSEVMRKRRSGLAAQYLGRKQGEPLPADAFADNSFVYDFFATVGVLLKRRVLDRELVWVTFYYWFVRYWELAEADVRAWRQQQNDETYWEECDYLYGQLVAYDARRRGISPKRFDWPELQRFAKEQSDLP